MYWDASPVSSPAMVLIHRGEVNKVVNNLSWVCFFKKKLSYTIKTIYTVNIALHSGTNYSIWQV